MNYSRQRELIFEALKQTTSHPTAENLYRVLRERHPRLSLATVYRNLGQLCDMGEIRRLRVNGSPDRFDGNFKPHYHFCCNVCGEVSDVDLDKETMDMLVKANIGKEITDCDVIFYGNCEKCIGKN